MPMWMVWMIWGVFLAVIFGLITDAVSETKGYAKTWFFYGLLTGPIALLVLLLRPDPEGQVSYINESTKPPETWRCPLCGTDNPAAHTWCSSCGNSRD